MFPEYRWERDLYVLQPLFRAVTIVIDMRDFITAKPVPVTSKTRVMMILAGIQDGLSAPISLDSIAADNIEAFYDEKTTRAVRTSLGTTVDFSHGLEAREGRGCGPQLDPQAARLERPPRFSRLWLDDSASTTGMVTFPLGPALSGQMWRATRSFLDPDAGPPIGGYLAELEELEWQRFRVWEANRFK